MNIEEQWVRVQPGVVLDHLNARLRPHGLMFGPDPASSVAATLGGMLGNNSTGSHSIVYGMTADHTLELEMMLADGRHVRPGPNFGGLDRDTTAALRAHQLIVHLLEADLFGRFLQAVQACILPREHHAFASIHAVVVICRRTPEVERRRLVDEFIPIALEGS